MRVVIINGIGGSGKDTFVEFCKDILKEHGWFARCMNISTVDYVKEIARHCGWDGEKDPASRKFLSDLKRAMTEWRDLPVQDIKNRIKYIENCSQYHTKENEGVIFVHCREPKEIDRLVRELNATTLLIRRDAAENIQQINDSDNNVLNYAYDYTVYNNDSLDALRAAALAYLREFLDLTI